MKKNQWTGWLLACFAAGSWTGAGAIEPPAPVEPPAVGAQAEAVPGAAGERRVEARAEGQAAAEQAPDAPAAEAPQAAKQAYLGVGGSEVPELLAEHLGLEQGGVVVDSLDPEGPAAKAGLAEKDVITKVGGKEVASQEELRDAVTARKPGEEIGIEFIHRGKVETRNLQLAERPAAVPAPVPQGFDEMLQGLPEDQAKRVREAIEQNLKALGGLEPGPAAGGDAGDAPQPRPEPKLPDALKQLEQRLGKAFRGMGNIVPGGGMQFNMQSSSSIRLMDGQGSVEMEMKDGSKQVRVRDHEGKVQWEGPYDTPQDKAAVPDDVRGRIERLNFDVIEGGQGGGLRMRIGPGGLEPPELPPVPKREPKPQEDKGGAADKPADKPAE